ncbi:MAG: hypothetical protein WAM66_07340 [Acidobacteriaceae bacterium]
MSADFSTQNMNGHAFRTADALLRANGGTTAYLQMPTEPGDAADGGQLGIDAPNFEMLALSPVVFQRARLTMTEGQPQKYELLISGSAVAAAVGAQQMASADLLFQMAAGVVVAGELFLIEAASFSESLGAVYMYRLLLRESASGWPMQSQS